MQSLFRSGFLATLICTLASSVGAGVAFFDAATDAVQVSGQTVLATAGTYEAIVLFPSAHSGGGGIFNEWQDFAEDKYFAIAPGADGALYGFDYGVSSGVFTSPTAVSLDQWHHVAYVYDGSEERLYLDGNLLQSRPASGDVSDADSSVSHVGAIFRDGASRSGVVGLIDVLRLSNVARYTGASFTPPSPNLASDANTVLLYTFDDAPGSATIVDASSLARTGTLGVGFGGATSPVLCGVDATDNDGDFIPDACDPDPPATTATLVTSVTTTTQPGSSCLGGPTGPTFAPLLCRLAALVTRASQATDLGRVQARLVAQITKSRDKPQKASTLCGQASRRKRRHALQPAIGKLGLARRTIGSHAARSVPQALRDEVRAATDGVRSDMRTLQHTVNCPEDVS